MFYSNTEKTSGVLKTKIHAVWAAAVASGVIPDNKAELARRLEAASGITCKPQTVNVWFSTGRMDKKWMAWFEKELQGSLGFSSVHQENITDEYPTKEVITDLRLHHASATKRQSGPILAPGRVGADLNKANNEWPEADLIAVITTHKVSARVKWIPVLEDDPGLDLKRDDIVAIDPDSQPQRDKVALFLTSDGYVFRKWIPLAGTDDFEAIDGSGHRLEGLRHGLSFAGNKVCLQRP